MRALRQATNFALDDLGETEGLRRTFVVSHFLPHLNRDSIWRILRAEGLNRRRPTTSAKSIVEAAKEASQPDTARIAGRCCRRYRT